MLFAERTPPGGAFRGNVLSQCVDFFDLCERFPIPEERSERMEVLLREAAKGRFIVWIRDKRFWSVPTCVISSDLQNISRLIYPSGGSRPSQLHWVKVAFATSLPRDSYRNSIFRGPPPRYVTESIYQDLAHTRGRQHLHNITCDAKVMVVPISQKIEKVTTIV
jgi:hypothetical protein